MEVKVFISWSGDLSRQVAEVLRTHLPLMLQDTEPFLSSHDIASGDRWGRGLAQSLEEANFGIVCLTEHNLQSPWLLFEAGALTKHADGSVCCLLLGQLPPTEVKPPLSQFQNRVFSKTEVRLLLKDINSRLPRPLTADQLAMVFDRWWPELHRQYEQALDDHRMASPDKTRRRTADDVLAEILATVRNLARAREEQPSNTPGDDPWGGPINEVTVADYTRHKFPHLGISEYWQRRLLDDIDPTRYPSLRHIDDVIEAARPALEAYSSAAPDVFLTGTDFLTKALGFIDREFRGRHPFSQETIDAFGKYGHLTQQTVK